MTRETRARRLLAIEGYRLQKTPSGYMVLDSRGLIVECSRHREYDATLEDVENYIENRLKAAVEALISRPPEGQSNLRRPHDFERS
jgi:hypothetical protein